MIDENSKKRITIIIDSWERRTTNHLGASWLRKSLDDAWNKSIMLSDCQIVDLPEEFFKELGAEITVLNLSNNTHFTQINRVLKHCPYLTYLNISGTGVRSITLADYGLDSLAALVASNDENNDTAINHINVNGLSQLKCLYARGNRQLEIIGLESCGKTLNTLSVGDNDESLILNGFEKLTSLTCLDLRNSTFGRINLNNVSGCLTALYAPDIKGKDSQLDGIENCTNLELLDLNNSDIELSDENSAILPNAYKNVKISREKGFKAFANLQKLWLSNTGLLTFDGTGLSTLQVLFLEDNAEMSKITGLGHCPKLRKFSVDGARQLAVISGLTTTSGLENFWAENTPKLLDYDWLQHHTNIQVLDISSWEVEEIDISHMGNLKELYTHKDTKIVINGYERQDVGLVAKPGSKALLDYRFVYNASNIRGKVEYEYESEENNKFTLQYICTGKTSSNFFDEVCEDPKRFIESNNRNKSESASEILRLFINKVSSFPSDDDDTGVVSESLRKVVAMQCEKILTNLKLLLPYLSSSVQLHLINAIVPTLLKLSSKTFRQSLEVPGRLFLEWNKTPAGRDISFAELLKIAHGLSLHKGPSDDYLQFEDTVLYTSDLESTYRALENAKQEMPLLINWKFGWESLSDTQQRKRDLADDISKYEYINALLNYLKVPDDREHWHALLGGLNEIVIAHRRTIYDPERPYWEKFPEHSITLLESATDRELLGAYPSPSAVSCIDRLAMLLEGAVYTDADVNFKERLPKLYDLFGGVFHYDTNFIATSGKHNERFFFPFLQKIAESYDMRNDLDISGFEDLPYRYSALRTLQNSQNKGFLPYFFDRFNRVGYFEKILPTKTPLFVSDLRPSNPIARRSFTGGIISRGAFLDFVRPLKSRSIKANMPFFYLSQLEEQKFFSFPPSPFAWGIPRAIRKKNSDPELQRREEKTSKLTPYERKASELYSASLQLREKIDEELAHIKDDALSKLQTDIAEGIEKFSKIFLDDISGTEKQNVHMQETNLGNEPLSTTMQPKQLNQFQTDLSRWKRDFNNWKNHRKADLLGTELVNLKDVLDKQITELSRLIEKLSSSPSGQPNFRRLYSDIKTSWMGKLRAIDNQLQKLRNPSTSKLQSIENFIDAEKEEQKRRNETLNRLLARISDRSTKRPSGSSGPKPPPPSSGASGQGASKGDSGAKGGKGNRLSRLWVKVTSKEVSGKNDSSTQAIVNKLMENVNFSADEIAEIERYPLFAEGDKLGVAMQILGKTICVVELQSGKESPEEKALPPRVLVPLKYYSAIGYTINKQSSEESILSAINKRGTVMVSAEKLRRMLLQINPTEKQVTPPSTERKSVKIR